MVNVAVIGAGRMGSHHGRIFASQISNCRVEAVCDSDMNLCESLSREIGAQPFADIDKMLALPSVDAVCIATPVATHKEFILKALAAKKHVFCEKPLTLTEIDAIEIMTAAEKSGCVFQLAFMRRFDDAFVRAKEKLAEGIIGVPVFIRSSGRDPGLPPVPGWGSNPEACGDISFELCSHDYDSMRWLMADEVVKVYGRAGILSSKDIAAKYGKMINDTLVVTMEFGRGALGSLDGLLNIKYGYDARVEIVGDEGILAVGEIRHLDISWGGGKKVISYSSAPSFLDRFHYAYIKQAQHFIECVLTGGTPKVGVADGLAAVKIAAAVNRSVQSGKPVSV